jgi:hypothetical protein
MDHVCGVDLASKLWCWGTGQFGYVYAQAGATNSPIPPHQLASDLSFQQISAGRAHTCAVSVAADAYCWGANAHGELGATSSDTCHPIHISVPCSITPIKTNGGLKFLVIAAASASPFTAETLPASHTCGIIVTQEILCWGSNAAGQLGDGTKTDHTVPTKVATALRFRSVSAGFRYTCGIATDGIAYCWGDNSQGQFGNGSLNGSLLPTVAAGGMTFK